MKRKFLNGDFILCIVILLMIMSMTFAASAANVPYLVKDINTTLAYNYGSSPKYFCEFNNLLYFNAFDQINGAELWKTDGTASGTILAKDILPGINDSNPESMVKINETIYFAATEPGTGTELWKTDGTDAGTVLVKDISPGPASSYPIALKNVNGTLFFAAFDPVYGAELWKSDGTEAGTVIVKDINPGINDSFYQYQIPKMCSVGGTVFFQASNGINGYELWKSDGTDAGTVMIKDINPGAADSYCTAYESDMCTANGIVFFQATEGVNGYELWKSDGTEAGTVLVKNIRTTGTFNSYPRSMCSYNNLLFFTATDGNNGSEHGYELWKSDGTEAGTVMVKDIYPGTGYSSLVYPCVSNGTLFFQATDGTNGAELWKSDGTEAGTVMVKDIASTFLGMGSMPAYMTDLNGIVYFQAIDTMGIDYELWRSDGTEAGTYILKDINPVSTDSNPADFNFVNGTITFTATDGINGTEFWKTDGTEPGTSNIKDIYTGIDSCSPADITNFGSFLVFSATNSSNDYELFKSDGTLAGTSRIIDIRSGTTGSRPRYLTKIEGNVYFSASNGSTGYELWKSDGTSAGTSIVMDITSGSGNSNPSYLAKVGTTLFFTPMYNNTDGHQLWKSDGTEAGTIMVKDLNPAGTDVDITEITDVNGIAYFNGTNGTNGYELWKSDGTEAGTVMVKDINPGSGYGDPTAITNLNGTCIFKAYDPTNGYKLWKSDGTETGTVILNNNVSTGDYYYSFETLNINNIVYFNGMDSSHGAELWKTDGTEAGTVLVKDINPGKLSSMPANFFNVNGYLIFSAGDSVNGYEIWMSDGTGAGTSLVCNIAPGDKSSNPNSFFLNGTTLYMNANDSSSDKGNELYGLSLTPSVPTNPGAQNITPYSIKWKWTDNSSAELGNEIYADEGTGAPATLRTTTAANITSWTQSALTPNSQYTMQVLTKGIFSDTIKSDTYTTWTLAEQPLIPVVSNVQHTTLDVSLTTGDGNPSSTLYAIMLASAGNGNQWVQNDGTIGSTPAWQTIAAWGTKTVTGLTPGKTYSVSARAKNNNDVQTANSMAQLITTTVTLTITSAYGSPSPAAGTSTQTAGTVINASVTSPVSAGAGIQYVCTGYTGTGSASNGSGTSCSFTINQDSTLTWNWKTQYELTVITDPSTLASGCSVTPAAGSYWYDSGASASILASSANGSPHFIGWTGAVISSNLNENIIMDSAKTVTATFGLPNTSVDDWMMLDK